MATLDELEEQLNELKEVVRKQLTSSPPNVPVGTVMPYAGPIDSQHELPDNWLLCNGSELLRDGEYRTLFEKIGVAWGMPSSPNKFKLPDLRGQFLRGVDAGAGLDKQSNREVGSFQKDSTRRPDVDFVTDTDGKHNHTGQTGPIIFMKWGAPNKDRTAFFGNDFVGISETRATISDDGNHHHTVTKGGDAETRPVNSAVHWIIRAK